METQRAENTIEVMRRPPSRVDIMAVGDELLLEQCALVAGGMMEEHL